MGNYRPEIPELRKILAFNILDTLETAGFTEIKQRRTGARFQTKERVFARDVTEDSRLQVKVFTTIVEDEVRNSGKDAIRVCATWLSSEGDRSRGVVAVSRVHRTGDIQAICERMLGRMREVWGRVKAVERCNCGSPKFKSKKGNMVCADLCWKRERQRGWQELTRANAQRGNVSHWAAVKAE